MGKNGISNAHKIASINMSYAKMAQQLAQVQHNEPVNHAKILESEISSLETELFMILMDVEDMFDMFDPSFR